MFVTMFLNSLAARMLQVHALDDQDVRDPSRVAALLKKPPMQLLLPTAAGQGPRWVRQVFVHCDSPHILELPHSNLSHVKRYLDKHH